MTMRKITSLLALALVVGGLAVSSGWAAGAGGVVDIRAGDDTAGIGSQAGSRADAGADTGAGVFRLPPYEKFVLANGLTVYLMEQHEVPLIYVSFVFPAGAVNDGTRYGLASLTAEGLLFGTKSYSKKQIEDELDFIGASYNVRAAKEFAEISLSFITKDRRVVFPILEELVTKPIFDEAEFEKRQKRLLAELEQAKESPRAVIQTYFDKFLFQDHRYGNPVAGNRATVAGITRDDLKSFYNSNYFPAGSAIAVTGDFETAEMKKAVTGLLAGWRNAGAAAPISARPIPTCRKSRVLLVNKDDATETRFLIGGFGIKRSNPDYVAVEVVNTVLGGRFTSWLNDELRITRGLTYGAWSVFSPRKETGTFYISSFTKTESTFEAIDAALAVLEKLHREGVDERTLLSAKNYVKGQYPPQYETAGDLASLLTSMFVFGFDESFINDFQKNVDELDVGKARRIIDTYFPRENLQFVLIGQAAAIRDEVAKYGEITEKDIKAVGF
jgi:zinc protease